MWMPRSCRKSCMNAATMQYQFGSGGAGGAGSPGELVVRARRGSWRCGLAAGFQVALHVQVDLAELVEGLGVGGLPQAAGGGLEQALGDAAQSPGVGLPHERPGLFVEDV